MTRILYYLVLLPLSLLPLAALYRVSDLLCLVLHRVVRYRVEVVRDNLRQAFPTKTQEELRLIEKRFYRHLADLVVESIKNFTISRKEALRRMVITNPEALNQLAGEGKSAVICGGHFANWETWALIAPIGVKHKIIGIYKALKDPFLNRKMFSSRGRFGMKLVPTKDTGAYLRSGEDPVKAIVLAFDQSPSDPHKCVWLKFLGRETAGYFGAEKYSRDYDMAIVYGYIRKVRRGYYEGTYRLITRSTAQMAEGELTLRLFRELEAQIAQTPEHWLWSHKRWKHRRPAEKAMLEAKF
jgi:KDO2-lipid IV(A) lauroyltransferase